MKTAILGMVSPIFWGEGIVKRFLSDHSDLRKYIKIERILRISQQVQ